MCSPRSTTRWRSQSLRGLLGLALLAKEPWVEPAQQSPRVSRANSPEFQTEVVSHEIHIGMQVGEIGIEFCREGTDVYIRC